MQGVNTDVDMENVLHAAHEVNLLPSVCSVIGWPSFFAIDAQFTRYAIMTGQVKRRGAERLWPPGAQRLASGSGSPFFRNAAGSHFVAPAATDVMELMRELPIILFGVGGVGQALLRQILDCRGLHAIQYGLHLQLLAVCDSNGAIVEPSEGIADEMLQEALTLKAADGWRIIRARRTAGRFVQHRRYCGPGERWSNIDCTFATQLCPVCCMRCWNDGMGWRLPARKKPLTIEQEVATADSAGVTPRSNAAARAISAPAAGEATVSAGLPVIATLSRLVDRRRCRAAHSRSSAARWAMSCPACRQDGVRRGSACLRRTPSAYRRRTRR